MDGSHGRELPQKRVDVRIALRGVRIRAAADDAAQTASRQTHGRMLARQRDVQQNAQRENVRPHVAAGEAELLRRGIARRAEQARVRVGRAEHGRGRVQIQQHNAALPRQHDVLRLHVAMDKAEAVERFQPQAELPRDRGRLRLAQKHPAQDVRQERPVDILLLTDRIAVRVIAGIDPRQLRRFAFGERAAGHVRARVPAQDTPLALRRLGQPERVLFFSKASHQPKSAFLRDILKCDH